MFLLYKENCFYKVRTKSQMARNAGNCKSWSCSYENSFPILFLLNQEKDIISLSSCRNISPPQQNLFWQAVRWESFERSQYLKWVT